MARLLGLLGWWRVGSFQGPHHSKGRQGDRPWCTAGRIVPLPPRADRDTGGPRRGRRPRIGDGASGYHAGTTVAEHDGRGVRMVGLLPHLLPLPAERTPSCRGRPNRPNALIRAAQHMRESGRTPERAGKGRQTALNQRIVGSRPTGPTNSLAGLRVSTYHPQCAIAHDCPYNCGACGSAIRAAAYGPDAPATGSGSRARRSIVRAWRCMLLATPRWPARR